MSFLKKAPTMGYIIKLKKARKNLFELFEKNIRGLDTDTDVWYIYNIYVYFHYRSRRNNGWTHRDIRAYCCT